MRPVRHLRHVLDLHVDLLPDSQQTARLQSVRESIALHRNCLAVVNPEGLGSLPSPLPSCLRSLGRFSEQLGFGHLGLDYRDLGLRRSFGLLGCFPLFGFCHLPGCCGLPDHFCLVLGDWSYLNWSFLGWISLSWISLS